MSIGLSFILRPALADDGGQSRADRRCDEMLGQTRPADIGSSAAPTPAAATNSVQAPLGPEIATTPIAQPPPLPPALAVPQPSPRDLWPIEYVLRPQTLPAGLTEAGVRASVFRPQSGPLATAAGFPYTFHSTLSLGLWVRVGLTERSEMQFYAPRILCVAAADPSGCSDINRFNATEISGTYGLVRSRMTQLKVFGGILIARSAKPLTFAWDVGTRTKILFGRVVALEMALVASRQVDQPESSGDTAARGSLVVDLNVQVTHHLLVFADLNPYAPIDHLDQIALEPSAGASWTFSKRLEAAASAGIYNVLARRNWDTGVPGSYYVLSMRFWF